MSIYVVGSTKNIFPELDEGREKFLVDIPHDGDNIDHLNPWYCELTALYHLWKNSKADIVGLEHYRRFFASPTKTKKRLTKDEANEILKDHDIIMCTYRHARNYSAYKWFCDSRKSNDLHAFIKILNDTSAGLGDAFFKYLNRRELRQCCMFITRKPIIDSYCEWLFPKLAAFDKQIGIGDNNKRIDGYFAEHIFGLWAELAQLKVYDCTKVEMHFLVRSGYPV